MFNLFKWLLIAFIFVWHSPAKAITDTNKTFFMPRPPGREKFLDFAASFRAQRRADNPDCERIGLCAQVTPFFRRSSKPEHLGSYFGAAGNSTFNYGKNSSLPGTAQAEIYSGNLVHQPFEFLVAYRNQGDNRFGPIFLQPAVTPAAPGPYEKAHLSLQDLRKFASPEGQNKEKTVNGPFTYASVQFAKYLEDFENFSNTHGIAGQITLKPESTAYGVKLGLYLNVPNTGYFKLSLPLVRVENTLGIEISDGRGDSVTKFLTGEYAKNYTPLTSAQSYFDDAQIATPLIAGTPANPQAVAPVPPVYDTRYNIYKSPATGQAAAQEALKFLKISEDKIKSDFGFGDLELTFGTRIVDEQTCDHAVFTSVVIPLSDAPKGEFLFEPLRGNGKHFEISSGFEGTADLYSGYGFNVEIFYNLNLGYVFRADETRTLDVLLDGKVQYPWQRYFLTGENGKAGALVPLANLTTLKVEVKPGMKAEGFVGIGVTRDQASLDFGWAFYSKEAEELRVVSEWPGKKYVVVNATDYRAYEPIDLSKNSPHTRGFSNHKTIELENLDLSSAATPAQLSQIFWGALSYNLQRGSMPPVIISLGGNYEFGHDNTTMTNWMIWGKVAVAF